MNAIKLILVAAVFATMSAEGMRVTPADLGAVWKHPAKLARGLFAVIVLVPVFALLVTALLAPSRPVALALAFLAAAPLAPFVLTKLAKSGEDFRLAASLHVALAATSIVSAPLVLLVLGRLLGFPTVASPVDIAGRVFVSLLLPFGLGAVVRRLAPHAAERLRKVLEIAGVAVLLGVCALLLVRGRGTLAEFGPRDYVAMALFCVLALAGGHFLAERDEERSIYALESAARNPGIALLMATSSLGPVRGAVILPYLVVFVGVTSLYSMVRKRTAVRPSVRPSAA